MQFAALLLAALATAVSASPVEKRSCAVQYPRGGLPINYKITNTASANVVFDIPSNARGPCSLIQQFPANYPITTTGNPQVNIVAVGGPASGAIVGTTTFGRNPWNDQGVTTINSFACRPNMEYRIEMAGQGSVSFAEAAGAGIMMTYNCW